MTRSPTRSPLVAVLAVASATSGCFALFSLDDYGPGRDSLGSVALPNRDAGGLVSDGASPDLPDGASTSGGNGGDATTVPTGRIVFVTSADFPVGVAGGVTGPTGADALCNAAAKQGNLSGTFVAWLSDQTPSAGTPATSPSRLATREDGYPLVTPTGQIIAKTIAELISTGPEMAIDVTESRGVLPDAPPLPADGTRTCPASGLVWTGLGNATNVLGPGVFAGTDCAAWTSGDAKLVGGVGLIVKDATQWTLACYSSCSLRAHLYCVQQ
jgi:hypothetical protein